VTYRLVPTIAATLVGCLLAGDAAAQAMPLTEKELVAQGARLVVPETAEQGVTNYLIGIGSNQVGLVNYVPAGSTTFLAQRNGRVFELLKWNDGDKGCSEAYSPNPRIMRTHICRREYDLGRVRYVCFEHEDKCNWVKRVLPGDVEGLLARKAAQDKADEAFASSPEFARFRWAMGTWSTPGHQAYRDSMRSLHIHVEDGRIACYWSVAATRECTVTDSDISFTQRDGRKVKLSRVRDRLEGMIPVQGGASMRFTLERPASVR